MESYSVDIMPETPVSSAREERKKTGQYIAVCTAIGITLLGLYQAMVSHTPVIGGLFAPAVIMFLYVFWVLYTANDNKKRLKLKQQQQQQQQQEEMTEKTTCSEVVTIEETSPETNPKDTNIQTEIHRKLTRSYSIA